MTTPDAGDAPAALGLTSAEWSMWQAFRNGSTCRLHSGDAARDDPHGRYPWGPERSVRARVVALLLLESPPAQPGRVSALKLTGAYITDTLDLAGGTVKPFVELRDCRFEKEVLLPESRFTTLRIVGCAVPRLEAARLHTEGDLHLPRCVVRSGIRLTDAHIGTDLLLNQTVVHKDRQGRSVMADGLTVAQDLQAEMLESYGEVSLRGATVGVSLSLRGSRLSNPYGRRALNAPQLTVERTLYLTAAGLASSPFSTVGAGTPPYGIGHTPTRGTRMQRFECEGGMRLDDGRFGDAVDLEQARFLMEGDQELSLRRIQTPELRFLCERPQQGRVILSGARVVNLVDKAASWPGLGGLWMAGFSYETLIPRGHFPLARRLEWVAAATPEYAPEPYEMLAASMRRSGEDSDAREALLAKQRRRRETLPLAAKAWGILQDWTVAYGYRPGRAAVWMAVLWALGTVYFSQSPPRAVNAGEAQPWNPYLYVLDLLLPVIDLHQETSWKPGGAAQWVAAIMILAGWVLATTVAAGASRLLRRQ
ncbi:oxidoreductase [Streptomyces sp. MST-110588]|uniref:oxidoreductase n=1 Tax=Streptomyces sp. MST-110588 TaxID=2833628 RepID=UPI001F5D9FF9|nr:oxidoreductase [Streptomyces sp. MST-110588]UNO42611.1 oxidoreductase [Streptomyces sp. MST-110588]